MTDMPATIDIVSATFYDLRQEITNGIGVLSREEIIEAKEIVKKAVGKELVEEKNARVLLYDTKSSDKLIIIYVLFDTKDTHDSRCVSKIFWIYGGKIIQVKDA